MRIEYAYWLAALIDGEGSIAIRDRKRPSGRFDFAVRIAQKDTRLLEVARERIGYGKIYDSHSRCHVLQIEPVEQVRALLEAVEPLLIIKRERAKLALAIIAEQGTFHPPRVDGKFVAV